MRTQDYLISARFMTTIGHLTALCILFSTIQNNIELSLGDNTDSTTKTSALETANSALVIGLICLILDFLGIFMGTSLFSTTANLVQIFFHFVGGLFLAWLITENWNYQALWPIVISCNLPTAIMEIIMLISTIVFKANLY